MSLKLMTAPADRVSLPLPCRQGQMQSRLVFRGFLEPAPRMAAALAAAVLGAAGGLICSAAEGDYVVRGWTVEDGLPENTVSAVAQTRDGYLWLGSYGGLIRFDGVRFTLFNHGNVPELGDNAVTSLFETDDGTLWIGHENGQLTRLKNGRFQAVALPSRAELGKVLGIGADETGAIWLLDQAGVLARAEDGTVLGSPAGVATNVVALTHSPRGSIWLARNGGILELSHGQLLSLGDDLQPASGRVQGLGASRDGGLWVAIEGRLRKWKDGGWERDLGAAPWGDVSVPKLIETGRGYLAAATTERGLFLVPLKPEGHAAHFCRTNGFPTDWIISLWEDHEGGLWVGTGGAGLFLLREKRVRSISPQDQWQGRTVLSVSQGKDGCLWIGTEGAGLYRYRAGIWQNFGAEEGLHPYVWSEVEDENGTLWIGTWGGGLYARRGGRIERVSIGAGTPPAISALLRGRNGGLWIGTESGLLRYNKGQTTWYRQSSDGQALRRIRAVVEDEKGGVWFGSLGSGLAHLKEGHIRLYRSQDGLASDFIECLYLDSQGALWIGTQGAGLCRLKDGRFATVSRRQGLPSANIANIQEDDQAFFWMSSKNGVMRASKADLERCLDGRASDTPCLAYGTWDGMPSATCSGRLQPAGCKTPDGKLWFPTTKGLVMIDTREAKARPSPPPVVIESISVDGQVAAQRAWAEQPVQIPPGRHQFEFQYTGLSFVAPEQVRFKYRLDGLDTGWVDAETKRVATYGHIQPGFYTFRVTACSSDGIWNSKGAEASFYVEPYYWQTWWFRALAAVGLVAASGGVAWNDSRRRMRRKVEQSERQRAVEYERSRIARDIHDDLGSHLTRITMLSESARSQVNRPEQVTSGLSQIYETARELTRAMDEIVWAVNPRHDSLEGLANYFEKFALNLLGAAGINCQLDFPLQFPGWTLTSEIRHNLFLAFKEALNNLVRHSGATEAVLTLRAQGAEFELVIEDNGRGFAIEKRPAPGREADRCSTGNGLENLRRRLAKAGGVCQIDSAPGKGTRVLFRIHVG